VVFLPQDRRSEIVAAATAIRDVERRQAIEMTDGRSLREQLDFESICRSGVGTPNTAFASIYEKSEPPLRNNSHVAWR
jgi:hypothetical protein